MSSKKKSPLDKFGRFVMQHLRDRAIDHHTLLQRGHWKTPAIQELQRAVVALPEDTKRLVLRCVVDSIDVAVHDFLFALQEVHDLDDGLVVQVDGTNVAELSDGLEGEPLGKTGWIAKHSEYSKLRRDA